MNDWFGYSSCEWNFLVIVLTINLIKRKNFIALDVPWHFIHTLFKFKIRYLFINLQIFLINDYIQIQPTYDLENIHSKYAFQNTLKGFFHLQRKLHICQLSIFLPY
jgi:hypothetical protein